MTVDEYLASRTPKQRVALNTLRKTIRAAAPGVTETIGYGIPMFKLNGRGLVAYSAGGRSGTSDDCALYVMSLKVLRDNKAALTKYALGKGTVKFTPEAPLPASIVTRLVKARVAEQKAGRPPGAGTRGG